MEKFWSWSISQKTCATYTPPAKPSCKWLSCHSYGLGCPGRNEQWARAPIVSRYCGRKDTGLCKSLMWGGGWVMAWGRESSICGSWKEMWIWVPWPERKINKNTVSVWNQSLEFVPVEQRCPNTRLAPENLNKWGYSSYPPFLVPLLWTLWWSRSSTKFHQLNNCLTWRPAT